MPVAIATLGQKPTQMKKSKILSLFAAAFVLGATASHAAVLVGYTFGTETGSATLAPTTQESGITGTSITPNTGTTALVSSGVTFTNSSASTANASLPFINRLDGHTVSGTPPTGVGIVDNPNYFSFTVTADSTEVPDANFSITDLQLDFGPGGSTARGFTAAFAVNGSSTFTQIGTVSQTGGGATSTTFTRFLFAAPATNVTSAEFRFFTFAQQATGRAMFYDNITVNGEVIPEPTTFAMLLGGFGTLLMLRRRRA